MSAASEASLCIVCFFARPDKFLAAVSARLARLFAQHGGLSETRYNRGGLFGRGDEMYFQEDHILAIHSIHRQELVLGMDTADLRQLAQWLGSQR